MLEPFIKPSFFEQPNKKDKRKHPPQGRVWSASASPPLRHTPPTTPSDTRVGLPLPTLFIRKLAGVQDEYTFCKYVSKKKARAALKEHWDTWTTEQDFADMAAAGLNHVRIPVGFWALDVSGGEPYVQGSMYYLRLAIAWAAEHGLHVLIDLREWSRLSRSL